MTDPSTITDTRPRAELYLRADAHSGLGVRDVVDRAARLAADGIFSESRVAGEWSRWLRADDDWHAPAMPTYEAFASWAERNGFSLEPGFQRRTRSFVGTDGTEEVVVFPTVALALVDDGELGAVFPCTDGTRTYTVADALVAFERNDEEWLAQFDPVRVDPAAPRSGPSDVTAD
jgi:hypothetical protein